MDTKQNVRFGLIQLHVSMDKAANVASACSKITLAAQQGAQVVVLPEMFNCPYSNDYFRQYAEPAGGETWQALADCARANKIVLVAGSFPELEGERVYNASFVFNRQGEQIARHRKMHLFDIDIVGGQRFCESETLTAGNEVTVFDTEYGIMGLCICFDMRFPELCRLMALKGAQVIIAPAAFNMTTGPAHWELLFRQRAVDNQLFTIGVGPARNENGVYVSYANSIVCSPWGDVLCRAGAEETLLITDLDLSLNTKIRTQLPLLSALRRDVYTLIEK